MFLCSSPVSVNSEYVSVNSECVSVFISSYGDLLNWTEDRHDIKVY